MTEKTTKEINLLRRVALYNIKAENTGFNDFFGKDIKKERELEIERQKIEAVLRDKNSNLTLNEPGKKKDVGKQNNNFGNRDM